MEKQFLTKKCHDKGVWQQDRATWLLGEFYFTDRKGLPVQEYRHGVHFWCLHDEPIIATVLAYQLTGQKKCPSAPNGLTPDPPTPTATATPTPIPAT